MRNSSLVEWRCAENVTGLKLSTEAARFRPLGGIGRGASCQQRSVAVRRRGDGTSENAGMSSEWRVRISSAECPRVPGEGSSAQG